MFVKFRMKVGKAIQGEATCKNKMTKTAGQLYVKLINALARLVIHSNFIVPKQTYTCWPLTLSRIFPLYTVYDL